MTNTMTNTEKFQTMKKQVERAKLACAEISLMDIKITSEEFIEVGNSIIPINTTAFKDLIQILGLNRSILRNFQELMNETAKYKLLKAMQNGLVNAGNSTVFMYATADKVVVRILKKRKQGMTDSMYLDTLERVLNDNSDLTINSFAVTPTSLNCNLLNSTQIIDIKDMHDEEFHFGLSINNDFSGGTSVSPFNERLVCTNGMVTRIESGTYSMKKVTAENYESFIEYMSELKKNNYIAPGFLNSVRQASNTYASVYELESARSLLQRTSNISSDVDSWLPIDNIKMKYLAKGVDLDTVSNEMKSTATTNVKVWDVVNGITDFASHQYNYKISDFGRNVLKSEAGKLLFKENFDMNNIMSVNPF